MPEEKHWLHIPLTGLVGVISISGMSSLSAADKEMYENNAKPMGEIAVLYDLLSTQRINAGNMVVFLGSDPQFSADEEISLAEKERAFEDSLARYEAAISGERRKALLSVRIPFVAAGQVYLPFMGIALQDQLYDEPKAREKLMPSAQLALFAYLYQENDAMHTSPLAEKLGVSAMQITRAVRQLHRLNLIDVSKEGVQVVISGKSDRRALFEKASAYLIDPVREIKYVQRGTLPEGLPYSGFSALSELSMLSAPMVTTRAFFSRTDKLQGENALTDSEKQVRVEVWKYAPAALSNRPELADPLSVVVSLRDERDERVEQAIEEVLDKMWR